MPGLLLIAGENGRLLKTYGVKKARVCNMQFAPICILIVLTCSVCASSNLEIYPGLKLNLNAEDRISRLINYEPNYYAEYKGYPYHNEPLDDYGEVEHKDLLPYDLTLPGRIRHFEEVINWEKAHLNRNGNQHQHFETPGYHHEFQRIYKPFRDSEKVSKHHGAANLNNQVLDNVRMYPQEDDFSFKNDDDEEVVLKLRPPTLDEEEDMFQENEDFSVNKARSLKGGPNIHNIHHGEVKLSEEQQFPSGAFRNIKVVEDPSKFAYAPSDSRFYEKLDTKNDQLWTPQEPNAFSDKIITVGSKDDELKVKSRSDQKVADEVQNTAVNSNFMSTIGESGIRGSELDVVAVKPNLTDVDSAGVYIIAIVAGISAAATVGLIAVGIGWYNLQKHVKNASDVEYPAYGVTGPNKDLSPSGDRRLAQSAQMYHYQHQKQQIIAMERAPPGERHGSVSDNDSDEENEEGDYTVYECPGLAPTGEMEVKNPLFQDDHTPAQISARKSNGEDK